MSTYHDAAYSDETINTALREAGFRSFEVCVAKMTTEGNTLSQIAEHLNLNAQRFCAYYHRWCRENAPTLRLGDTDE